MIITTRNSFCFYSLKTQETYLFMLFSENTKNIFIHVILRKHSYSQKSQKTHLFTIILRIHIYLQLFTENTFILRKHIYSSKTHLFSEIFENTFIHSTHMYSQKTEFT